MEKFTFIVEYKGGTYISQHSALNLKNALFIWAEKLDKKIFSPIKQERIRLEIQKENNFPTPIKAVDNVWCCCLLSGKYFLLMNIVKTI